MSFADHTVALPEPTYLQPERSIDLSIVSFSRAVDYLNIARKIPDLAVFCANYRDFLLDPNLFSRSERLPAVTGILTASSACMKVYGGPDYWSLDTYEIVNLQMEFCRNSPKFKSRNWVYGDRNKNESLIFESTVNTVLNFNIYPFVNCLQRLFNQMNYRHLWEHTFIVDNRKIGKSDIAPFFNLNLAYPSNYISPVQPTDVCNLEVLHF